MRLSFTLGAGQFSSLACRDILTPLLILFPALLRYAVPLGLLAKLPAKIVLNPDCGLGLRLLAVAILGRLIADGLLVQIVDQPHGKPTTVHNII